MTILRLSLSTVAIFAVIQVNAQTPMPAPEKPDSRGTFVPNAGYTRTIQEERIRREAAAQRTAEGAPTVGGLKGSRLLPVICVKFNNVPEPFPIADYQDLLFGTTQDKTMTRYYGDISNGKFRVSGKVVGWYQLPKDDKFYENNSQGNGAPFGELLEFALTKADADIDFAQFDNDGPDGVPNSGDDDGKVDTVVIIHSDSGAECGGASSPHIWSHSWHYSEPGYGHAGKSFVTRAIRRDSNGAPVLGPDGKPQHIVVDDYVIQPGVACPQAGNQKQKIQIGVFCHEYGHALGLPDLYDRTPNGHPDSEGLGNWCLMAGGSYGGDGRHADTPVSMSAWCKEYLGWATVQTIGSVGEIPLEPVEDKNAIYRIDVPNTDEREYFLIEYRDNGWKDITGSHVNWDAYLPVSGLAVWHIDERVGRVLNNGSSNQTWPFTPDDQGQNDAPTLPNPGHTQFRKGHSLVTLVEADGQLNLASGRYRAGQGDLWITGMAFQDDPTFRHGSRAFNGQETGISLTKINLAEFSAMAQNATRISGLPIHGHGSGALPSGSGPADSIATNEPQSSPLPSPAEEISTSAATSRPGVQAPESKPSPEASTQIENNTAPERSQSLSHVNQVLKQADVDLSDLQGAADKKNLATKLNEHLEKQGIEKISGDDLAKISSAKLSEIAKTVEPDKRSLVQALGAENRTKAVHPEQSPTTAAESEIVKLLSNAKQSAPARVQTAPEGTKLERVTELAIPVKTSNVAADAKNRVTQELQQAIGDGVELKPKDQPTTESSTGTVARFQQVVQEDQKSLPIFGTETALYYSKGGQPKLTAITSKTVDVEQLKISGTPGALPLEEAKKLVSTSLKVDAAKLGNATEGIYLVTNDPQQAHVAVLVPVRVDEHHDDIKVFVDSQTKQVLEVK